MIDFAPFSWSICLIKAQMAAPSGVWYSSGLCATIKHYKVMRVNHPTFPERIEMPTPSKAC